MGTHEQDVTKLISAMDLKTRKRWWMAIDVTGHLFLVVPMKVGDGDWCGCVGFFLFSIFWVTWQPTVVDSKPVGVGGCWWCWPSPLGGTAKVVGVVDELWWWPVGMVFFFFFFLFFFFLNLIYFRKLNNKRLKIRFELNWCNNGKFLLVKHGME